MALVNVADFVWNDIARTQQLRTPWARRAFALDNQQMADLDDADYFALKDRVGSSIASGFINVRPLFFENVAISRYVANRPELRGALPKIVTSEKGALVASMDDWFIQDDERTLLAAFLESELHYQVQLESEMMQAFDELAQLLRVDKRPKQGQ